MAGLRGRAYGYVEVAFGDAVQVAYGDAAALLFVVAVVVVHEPAQVLDEGVGPGVDDAARREFDASGQCVVDVALHRVEVRGPHFGMFHCSVHRWLLVSVEDHRRDLFVRGQAQGCGRAAGFAVKRSGFGDACRHEAGQPCDLVLSDPFHSYPLRLLSLNA
ncbi:hypothetical protein ACFV07_15520 [Streptomyces anulatus]|uniref:hypothetical protein n=1 Tax=Streptomyces anulatus TaxID=1892 RepID=UPI0036CDBEFD